MESIASDATCGVHLPRRAPQPAAAADGCPEDRAQLRRCSRILGEFILLGRNKDPNRRRRSVTGRSIIMAMEQIRQQGLWLASVAGRRSRTENTTGFPEPSFLLSHFRFLLSNFRSSSLRLLSSSPLFGYLLSTGPLSQSNWTDTRRIYFILGNLFAPGCRRHCEPGRLQSWNEGHPYRPDLPPQVHSMLGQGC